MRYATICIVLSLASAASLALEPAHRPVPELGIMLTDDGGRTGIRSMS